MKMIGLLALCGLSTANVYASCNIDFEVQGELEPSLQYQLTYYNTLHSRKTMDLNNLAAFTKTNIELPDCPQKHKADMTITYTKEGISYIVFESHLFPNQSSIIFSNSNTLTFRSCAGCDLPQYRYVAKQIQQQGMDKELNALVVQQADYLDYLRYADVRAVFGERSKAIVKAAIEGGYTAPPNIGAIKQDPPHTRNVLEQWLAILAPQKSFKNILGEKTRQQGAFADNEAMTSKISQTNPTFFEQLTNVTKGFKDKTVFTGEVQSLIAPFLSTTDADIKKLINMINESLTQALSLSEQVNRVVISKGEINNPKPDDTARLIANWFRLLHTIESGTPEQLAMFSAQFRADVMTDILNRDDSKQKILAATIKKYSKAIRYSPLKSSDKDVAAYNMLLDEFKGKAEVNGKRLTLKDADSGQQLEWVYENNSWKLDAVLIK